MTSPRQRVRDVLARSQEFRSAQDVYLHLRRAGTRVSLTTVYRALHSLADTDEVDVLRTTRQVLYRDCGSDMHHHHLTCRECGTTVDVVLPGVERWIARTAAEHGLSSIRHVVELYGCCSACTELRRDRP